MRIINPHDDVLMGNAGSTADGAETALRLHVALYWLMATSCFFLCCLCASAPLIYEYPCKADITDGGHGEDLQQHVVVCGI